MNPYCDLPGWLQDAWEAGLDIQIELTVGPSVFVEASRTYGVSVFSVEFRSKVDELARAMAPLVFGHGV